MKNKKTVCAKNQCTGCMACVDMCSQNAISIVDTKQNYNAVIDEKKCISCELCMHVCQNNSVLDLQHPQSWYQGWTEDPQLREKSSSGGAARAIAEQFIQDGGVVVSCCFTSGKFCFREVEDIESLDCFTGSKYVKSNPSGIYRKIRELLRKNRKVLFIGLPCQVGAVKTVIGESERLYTVDLICHGTPSPKVLTDFLASHKVDLNEVSSISFRYKDIFGLSKNQVPLSQPGSCDNYLLAFLCGLDYTDNCYECRYAGINRFSDITLGDSWKSELPDEEQKHGISLILCQTTKGEQLVKKSKMKLFSVNLERAISANDQLRAPFPKTKKHDLFFVKYSQRSFNYATFCCLPDKCIKQRIKAILFKTKILRGGKI